MSFKSLAVVGAGDLAADAAAARRVRHQHRIAAGERQIGGERRALGAALLLDHLHQHDLPALDDFLDLVLPAQPRRALGHFLHGVGAADQFDDFLLAFGAVGVDFGDVGGGTDRFALARLGRRGDVGCCGVALAGGAFLGAALFGVTLPRRGSARRCARRRRSEPAPTRSIDSSWASSIGASVATAVGAVSSPCRGRDRLGGALDQGTARPRANPSVEFGLRRHLLGGRRHRFGLRPARS